LIPFTIKGNNKMANEEMMMESESPLAPMIEQAEMADEDMYDTMAPEGSFSKKALNALVKSTNKLLPAFDQTPDYPTFSEDLTKLPTDFTRVLAMFSSAAADAVMAEAIDPEMSFQLEDISDDRSLLLLAGKLDNLAKSREFKRFLKEPAPEREGPVVEEAVEGEDMGEGEIEDLFMARM